MSENAISDEILILEEKREALERVIAVVNSLEAMAEGLKASMELGKSAEELPLTLLKAYNSLGKKVRNSSDDEILSKIETVDAIVKNKLKSILLLTEGKTWTFFEAESQKHQSSLFNEIDNFVRLTHTNIALRVLIEKRTGKTLPFKSLVSESQIRKNVELIEKSEIIGRKKIVEDIKVIMKDVNALLAMPRLNEIMRTHLEDVKEDLRQGLKHVISGKPIKALPVDIAVMNLSMADDVDLEDSVVSDPRPEVDRSLKRSVARPIESDASAAASSAATSTDVNAETAKSEVKIAALDSGQKKNGGVKNKHKEKSNAGDMLSIEPVPTVKQSLWRRFCLWLNSPWSTSWRDLKGQSRKRK